jgi:type IV pilus assembly protein PilA
MQFTVVGKRSRLLLRIGGVMVALSLVWVFLLVPVLGCGCGYTPRAQVSEGLNLAAAAKAAVAETFLRTNRMPRDGEEAGMMPDSADTHGRFVSSVVVVDGRIDISYGNEAGEDIAGHILSLTPYGDAADDGDWVVVWRCGYAEMPRESALALAAYRPGNIPIRALPSACR